MNLQNYSNSLGTESGQVIEWFNAEGSSLVMIDSGWLGWLQEVACAEHQEIAQLRYIFCDDAYLLPLNRRYLGHDTLTDVLTFDYREDRCVPVVEGEIYISVERVAENAVLYGVGFEDELARVMVHGLLHLLGYLDGSTEERGVMRRRENFYLKKLGIYVDYEGIGVPNL